MIRRIQNFTDKQVFGVLVATAIFSLGFSMWSHLMTGNVNWWAWADGALQNFSTEMMGAIATFALIEVIVGNRNEREKIIINLSSRDSSTALAAWGVAEAKGWLNDGSLRGVNIHGGNLI